MIPSALYKEIIQVLPLVNADVILTHKNKFLLMKRAIPPLKGKWHSIGGRIERGETPEQAARRESREETGLSVEIKHFLGVENLLENMNGITRHTISIVFLAHPRSKNIDGLTLNFENKEAQWFTKIPKNASAFARKYLRQVGFR